jgi:hypothetical protein
MLQTNDVEFVVWLSGASGCSLDSSPKKNWVEKSGGLPNYICQIARAVMRSGKSKSAAIAIAVSRTKKWAAGGDDVDADTRAKAAAAVAEWEKLKAKSHTKLSRQDGSEYILLSNASYNVDAVRQAWNARDNAARAALRTQGSSYSDIEKSVPYTYVRELWNDKIIIETEGSDGQKFSAVPYAVDDGKVVFGEGIPIQQEWVVDQESLSEQEQGYLSDVLVLSAPEQRIQDLWQKLKGDGTTR